MSLFNVTAPRTIRYPDGSKKLIIAAFAHPKGLLFFEPYWHLGELSERVHLIEGEVTGDGPWKIADHVITVTGCQGADVDMANAVAEWQQYLNTPGNEYPGDHVIEYLAGKLGAQVA